MTTASDFTLANHGSILVLTPDSDAAKAWVAEHLNHHETHAWGGGTVIEPRYWQDIQDGLVRDGLTVEASA